MRSLGTDKQTGTQIDIPKLLYKFIWLNLFFCDFNIYTFCKNTYLKIENEEREKEKKIKKNEHVRFLGSDYKKNDLIIKKGTIIHSTHILALKTLGISKIKVKRKPNILFFSTGNEISNKDNIPNWQVRNSNSHYIKSLESNFLFNFISGGILKDNHEHLFKKPWLT